MVLDRLAEPQTPFGSGSDALRGAVTDLPVIGDALGSVGRLLLVIVATGALVGLAVVLITAGLLNLMGFKTGDVARLTPPGRAATIAEVAVGATKG